MEKTKENRFGKGLIIKIIILVVLSLTLCFCVTQT